MNTAPPIIVIGSGLAAFTTIREFRKIDKETPVTLITQEHGDFYSKPMLSTAFASNKEPHQLVTTSKETIAKQLQIEIMGNTFVQGIDANQQQVVTDHGAHRYSKLILAVGADPIRLSINGNAADQVLSVNDLTDYSRFRTAINHKKRVAILGAGLIGCEFANDLVLGGYEVDVIDPSSQPLGRLLPEDAGTEVRGRLGAIGVRWHFGTTAQSINQVTDGLTVTLANQSIIHTDVVLSAVGLRPRTQIANATGIKTGRGIIVNRQMQTNIPNIYAIGDCAEVDGLVLPYVMPIMNAAKTLGAVLANQDARVTYPPMPVVVKTPAIPMVVSPPAQTDGQWIHEHIDNGMISLFKNNQGELLGFTLIGDATSQRATLTKSLPPVLA